MVSVKTEYNQLFGQSSINVGVHDVEWPRSRSREAQGLYTMTGNLLL